MNLLEEELPELSLRPGVPPSEFFDRCEKIAATKGYRIDRRREYAGKGFDQLNLHLLENDSREMMVRMVLSPREPQKLNLDVVARWESFPLGYEEYMRVAKLAYKQLLADYKNEYGVALRLGVPRRPPTFDPSSIDCGRISYAQEKFQSAIRYMAIGPGDARERLRSVFMTVHVIRPDDLPVPLNSHLSWVYKEMTWRNARHKYEGTLDATLTQMRKATASRIAERVLDIVDAVALLDEMCQQPSAKSGRAK